MAKERETGIVSTIPMQRDAGHVQCSSQNGYRMIKTAPNDKKSLHLPEKDEGLCLVPIAHPPFLRKSLLGMVRTIPVNESERNGLLAYPLDQRSSHPHPFKNRAKQ